MENQNMIAKKTSWTPGPCFTCLENVRNQMQQIIRNNSMLKRCSL
jgi:hypothetical protein